MTAKAKIRLHVNQELGEGHVLELGKDAAHYLFGVMRQQVGAQLFVFNNDDGEYIAEVQTSGKRAGTLKCLSRHRAPQMPPDLWLIFAPIKKARTDFIVEKACELGVRKICPVRTDFTNSERIRQDRLQAHAIEAAEQCGSVYVPPVEELCRLSDMLSHWQEDRTLHFCDEQRAAEQTAEAGELTPAPAAILIGPEGGFSPAEQQRLRSLPFVRAMRLGPRILRADTAAVAALTLWQASRGDW